MPRKKAPEIKKTVDPNVVGLKAEVISQPITETLEQNYMPYAMSVIVSRAIPEIDGFKPSHRKLLYTMYKMNLLTGGRTKSANIVGQTMRLNPHGDAAIYETMVRLSKGYGALLTPFVDSKGNFGKVFSRDMSYAASRYTEAKLAPICTELFGDIDSDTVDFVDNYDGSMKEPALLPTRFPNVLVSANLGIAVGMASQICGFNLEEVCRTTIAYLEDPNHDLLSTLPAPDFPTGGEILYKGQRINGKISRALDRQLTREIQMIFQDPQSSLNERAKVSYIVGEGLQNVRPELSAAQREEKVRQALLDVGLLPEFASRFPHEFSGGQRQRVGIARALALEPDCIFCDEPISALDVSVQVQIVNMLQRLQKERNLAYLFIAHDLAMVHHLSRRIGVMYLGRLVELGDGDAVYHRPLHPYTQALIAAVPVPDPHCRRQVCLSGEVPSPLDPPAGCVFHPRCPLADERCRSEVPVLRDMGAGRMAACHHAGKEAL